MIFAKGETGIGDWGLGIGDWKIVAGVCHRIFVKKIVKMVRKTEISERESLFVYRLI